MKKSMVLCLGLIFAFTLAPSMSIAGEYEKGVKAGQQIRADLDKANELVNNKKFDQASKILDKDIAFYKSIMTDKNAVYVSLDEQDDLIIFKKEHPTSKPVVQVPGYSKALSLKAYIASDKQQWPSAMKYLAEEIKYNPYSANAYNEQGYVLNMTKRPKEALKLYEKGFETAVRFKYDNSVKATALRGKGYALTEMGDLKGAKKAYEESLKLEPNNQTALDELKYIKNREAKNKF